jgi:hypothetical protein
VERVPLTGALLRYPRRVATPRLGTKDFQRTTLRPRHRPVVAALAEAYFSEGEPMSEERLAAFTAEVDAAISNASKTLRFGLRLMLDALRFVPLFTIGRARLFEDLPLGDRARVLAGMERSSFIVFSTIFVAWKTLMAILFFEDDALLRDLGYPGPARTRYRLGVAKE